MIIQALHRQPAALDGEQHRRLRLQWPVADWSVASKLNSIFVAAVEFIDACLEYPIVFVRAGTDAAGKEQVAPVAVLGVMQEQNLYLDGGRWRAAYLPAVLRSYPMCTGPIDAQRYAICVDVGWSGVGEGEGQALFHDDGRPTELLEEVQKHLATLENEVQRTRLVGQRLLELNLLQNMRFDATLADGRTHTLDGFLTVDQARLRELPDAVVGELHRNGVLALVHQHLASLGHMRRLVEWHAARDAASGAAPATPAAAP